MTRKLTRIAAAVTVAATLGIGGCGTNQPPVCDSLENVEKTMLQIRNLNMAENGLNPLRGYLNQLKGEVDQLLTQAADQFAPEVAAVRTAADQVSASVAAARETPDAAHLSTVRTTTNALATELRTLRDAMSGTC
jgi:hypothetical protein